MLRITIVALALSACLAEDDVYHHTQLLQTKVSPQTVAVDTAGAVQDEVALFQKSLLFQVQREAQPSMVRKADETGDIDVVIDAQLDLASDEVAKYVAQMPTGTSIVSLPRLQATAALAMLASKLNGDFAETGVYTGGTSILIAKVMLAHDNASRQLWAADSFEGLPSEDVTAELAARAEDNAQKLPQVASGNEGMVGQFSSSRQVFEQNLAASGLGNSPRIKVLQGWFNETLPVAPIQKLAFLRLDGDIYISTMDALEALYDKVVPGGYVYVDDYGSFTGCRDAVNQFLHERHAAVQLHAIPEGKSFEAVWWQKA